MALDAMLRDFEPPTRTNITAFYQRFREAHSVFFPVADITWYESVDIQPVEKLSALPIVHKGRVVRSATDISVEDLTDSEPDKVKEDLDDSEKAMQDSTASNDDKPKFNEASRRKRVDDDSSNEARRKKKRGAQYAVPPTPSNVRRST